MKKVSVIFHSGYGHTKKVAEHVALGVEKVLGECQLINVDELDDAKWALLDSSDAIIFGCPTYMGGVSAKFKAFIDSASGRWMRQTWKDKLAAGFTNSGSMSGDKLATLFALFVNASQHGMIWVGQVGASPSLKGLEAAQITDVNRIGSWVGLMTQSNQDSPEITPASGDLETAELFGERIAAIAKKIS